MSARSQLLGLALLALPPVAAGQWRVGAELGLERFGGTSRDTSGATANGAYRPRIPAMFGVRIERKVRSVTLGVAVSYASAALSLDTDGPTLFVRGSMTQVRLTPEIGGTVARLSSGAAVVARAGPLVEGWTLEGEEPRWRAGGHVGLALDFPLARRLAGLVTVRLGVTPSVFEAGELPPEFERRTSWRTAVALGLRYGS